MKVELERSFPLPASAGVSWGLLQDIEGVAACMPGARITERLDDSHYKGTVSVRVGPASMSFKGDIEVMHVDAASRSLRLVGKGSDSTGTSGASMDLTARIEAGEGAACSLVGRSEVSMSGKAATFGGRMMGTVADQILKQFAANFASRVQALQEREAEPAAPEAEVTAAEPARGVESQAAPSELNGLALLWAVIRDWVRGLFSRKAT